MPTTKEEQLKTLKAAYHSGVLRVRFGDNEVTYQSAADMQKIITRLEQEIHGAKSMKFITPKFSKGLE